MAVSKRAKFVDWLSDLRHRVMDYPLDEIIASRNRVIDPGKLSSPIPRKIVQTYRSARMPRPLYSAARRWQETNPEFDYRFFDDEAMRQFIADNYPNNVIIAFDALRPGAFRADLWRYCYLAAKGGVYVDIRMEPLIALRSILGTGSRSCPIFVGVADLPHKVNGLLYNAFIASTAGHPFLMAAIELAVANISNSRYGRFDLDITGPGCFGAAVNTCLQRPADTNFEPGDYDDQEFRSRRLGPFRILRHNFDTWHQAVVSMNGEPCIRNKCIGGIMAKADPSFPDKSYNSLYRKRQIFKAKGVAGRNNEPNGV